jgi:hypothetical protein
MEKESHYSGLLGGELIPQVWCGVEDAGTSPFVGGFVADLDSVGGGSRIGGLW